FFSTGSFGGSRPGRRSGKPRGRAGGGRVVNWYRAQRIDEGVAHVEITGTIGYSQQTAEMLLAEIDHVESIVLHLDTDGGCSKTGFDLVAGFGQRVRRA